MVFHLSPKASIPCELLGNSHIHLVTCSDGAIYRTDRATLERIHVHVIKIGLEQFPIFSSPNEGMAHYHEFPEPMELLGGWPAARPRKN